MQHAWTASAAPTIPDFNPAVLPPLRSWLKENPHFPPTSEEQLIMFAHSCYYDVEKTKQCIESSYTLMTSTPEFFSKMDLDLPELRSALTVVEFGCLPKKTPEGYQIVMTRLSQYEPSKFVLQDAVKLLSMTLRSVMLLDGPQKGYYFVFDMTGARLGHLACLSISHIKKVLLFVQEALPVRLKGIHIVNTTPIIDKVMLLIKPFMKKELHKLMHFYSTNELHKLYRFIPRDCLPSDFGGTLTSFNDYHVANTERMISLKKFWEEEGDNMVMKESLRPNKKDLKKKQVGHDIKKLELD